MTPSIEECLQCDGFGSIGDGPFSCGTPCSDCHGSGAKEAKQTT